MSATTIIKNNMIKLLLYPSHCAKKLCFVDISGLINLIYISINENHYRIARIVYHICNYRNYYLLIHKSIAV